jgi:hypothetical protein
MPSGLSASPAIGNIATELGISLGKDPVRAIVGYCQAVTSAYMTEYGGCSTSDELLYICAQKTGTRFEVASSNEDLDRVMRSWADRGERQFATVEREFERGVLGITFKLRRPAEWEPPFVSVIDARGERRNRAWFTKWHELGHLLILSDRSRESFCRTHVPDGVREPEEALVDRIAGACGFHPVLVRAFAGDTLTFDKVEAIRQRLCPEASAQASRFGIVNAWPDPCLLLACRMARSRSQSLKGNEMALRAVVVSANDAARMTGLAIFANMRVPQRSVIARVFEGKRMASEIENLNWWASSGRPLTDRCVLVCAEASQDGAVCALLATVS